MKLNVKSFTNQNCSLIDSRFRKTSEVQKPCKKGTDDALKMKGLTSGQSGHLALCGVIVRSDKTKIILVMRAISIFSNGRRVYKEKHGDTWGLFCYWSVQRLLRRLTASLILPSRRTSRLRSLFPLQEGLIVNRAPNKMMSQEILAKINFCQQPYQSWSWQKAVVWICGGIHMHEPKNTKNHDAFTRLSNIVRLYKKGQSPVFSCPWRNSWLWFSTEFLVLFGGSSLQEFWECGEGIAILPMVQ